MCVCFVCERESERGIIEVCIVFMLVCVRERERVLIKVCRVCVRVFQSVTESARACVRVSVCVRE